VDWPRGWQAIGAAVGDGQQAELAREVAPGHPLFGLPTRAIGLGGSGDDVLFAVEDGTGRVAAVHLTWTHNPPDCPPLPWAELYPSFSVWSAEEMQADADGSAG
jgi:hypothetical protein